MHYFRNMFFAFCIDLLLEQCGYSDPTGSTFIAIHITLCIISAIKTYRNEKAYAEWRAMNPEQARLDDINAELQQMNMLTRAFFFMK